MQQKRRSFLKKYVLTVFFKQEGGQGLTEYLLILILVSLSAVVVTQSLGKQIKQSIRKSSERIRTQVIFED